MLDEYTRRVVINNEIICLGETQARALYYLICNKHRRVSREELAEYVYKYKKPKNIKGSIAAVIFTLARKTKNHIAFRRKANVGYRVRWVE